jgi:hypothetical protein
VVFHARTKEHKKGKCHIMKYYIIENVPRTLEIKIITIGVNGTEEFSATIPVHLTDGYCRCLEDFGYHHFGGQNNA